MTKNEEKIEKLKKECEKLSPESKETMLKLIEIAQTYSDLADIVEKNSQDDE